MDFQYFRTQHREPLREALVVAEEMTSDHFKLTSRQWLTARYDITTLADLRAEEISPHALAMVAKYGGFLPGRELNSSAFDFYRVCLQDHNILNTLDKQTKLALLPLLIYVITHELVHIVRFSQFHHLFEATTEEKEQEEKRVHSLTREILKPFNCPDLEEISLYYQDHHN